MKKPTRTKGRSCTGKRRHDTRKAALAHRAWLIRRGAVRLTAYRCVHCDGFHVGHRPKSRS